MPLSLSLSGQRNANWFASSIYLIVVFDTGAAIIEPGVTFYPHWEYMATWLVFGSMQALWGTIGWCFASFKQMPWKLIVLLLLVYALPERAIEVVTTLHSYPLWSCLRAASWIAHVMATVFGVILTLNVWQKKKADGLNGMV